jgi:hypothetical protein
MYPQRSFPAALLEEPLIRKCAQGDRPRTFLPLISSLDTHDRGSSRAQKQGDDDMLGIIAAVLIILWLLGFFAFHVTSAFIHVALVVGLILLVMHFVRGSAASA